MAQREAVDLAEVLVVVRSDIIFMTIGQLSEDHEGRLLDEDLAEKLEFLWIEYLHKNHEIFNTRNAWVDEFEYGDLSE